LTSNKFKHLFIIPENVDIALLSVAFFLCVVVICVHGFIISESSSSVV